MANGDIHTQPYGSRWVNRVEGNSRPSNIRDTKDEARREGREMAIRNKVEHLIHNQDHWVEERKSYRSDPASRAG